MTDKDKQSGIGDEPVADNSPGAHTPPAPAVDSTGEAPDKELAAEYAEAEEEAKEPKAKSSEEGAAGA